MRVVLPALLAILLVPDGFEAGVQAYRESRPDDALRSFAAHEADRGTGASPELLYDLALAALAVKDPQKAESAAERMAARGGAAFFARRDFLLGNASYQRSEHAEEEAAQPEAELSAYPRAIQHARDARDHWIRAALSRRDWPEARRNVERAIARIAALEAKQDAAMEERRKAKASAPPPPPRRPNRNDLGRLLDLLEKMEADKQRQRAQHRAGAPEVEQDW
jgi:hypothetical protein